MDVRQGLRRLLAWLVLTAIGAALLAWLWFRPWEALGIIALTVVTTPLIALGLFPGIWRRKGDRPADAASDLDRRRPVWRVLSELYLDTELDAGDHTRIASVLRASGYSADQLEEILYRELHPVLHANLLSVAGEWAGFDDHWLEQRVLARAAARRGVALILGKWMVRREWQAIRTMLL